MHFKSCNGHILTIVGIEISLMTIHREQVELELHTPAQRGGVSDWGAAEWRVVQELGATGGAQHYGQQPWASAEGRLYSFGRGGLREWAW